MLFIKNGYVKPITGEDIENGAVLIDDNGKIAAVGKDLKAPEGATVIDAKGQVMVSRPLGVYSSTMLVTADTIAAQASEAYQGIALRTIIVDKTTMNEVTNIASVPSRLLLLWILCLPNFLPIKAANASPYPQEKITANTSSLLSSQPQHTDITVANITKTMIRLLLSSPFFLSVRVSE